MKISKKTYPAVIIILIFIGITMSLPFLLPVYDDLMPCDIFCKFNNDVKDSKYQKSIGLSIVNLPALEDKQIKNIIRSSFEAQWGHFNDDNLDKIDELIKDLYLPEGYKNLKKQMELGKEDRKQHGGGIEVTSDEVVSYVNDIKFSKFRKYDGLDDRIGVMAGSSFAINYFLFKKISNKWFIENEKEPYIANEELNGFEFDIVHELLLNQQTNNIDQELKPTIAGWKVYENKEYGFRVDYPVDWRVRETKEYSDLKINAISLVSPEVLNIDNLANERIKKFNSPDLDNFFTYNSSISIFRYSQSAFELKYGAKSLEELVKINDGTIREVGKKQIDGIEATDFISVGDDHYYNIMFANKGFLYNIFLTRATKDNIPDIEKQILSSFQFVK